MINVKHTSIEISPYKLGDQTGLERTLSVYNKDYFRYDPIGYDYDETTETLRIPRSISIRSLERTFEEPATIDSKPDEFDKAIFNLKFEPRDDNQRKAIAFLLGKEDYQDIINYSRRMLELDMNMGKTYCAIATAQYMKVKFGVILHNQLLMDQWKSRITQYTNISEKEIFTIKGSTSIDKILKADKLPYKAYLISHQTIESYGRNSGWSKVTELFKKIKIGFKIFDEAHLQLENTIKIDIYTNTRRTVYLTGTAERTQYAEDRLFNVVYGTVPILTIKRPQEESKIKGVIIQYDSKPSVKDVTSLSSRHGMNVNAYMDYSIKGKGKEKFFKSLYIAINSVKDNDGQVAIMLLRKDATVAVSKFIKLNYKEFTDKDVGIYTSDIKDKKEREANLKKKFIVTTTRSFGTGTDISSLKTIIMCEPTSSKVTLKQTANRLRGAGYYIEIMDVGFQKRWMQFNRLKKTLVNLCKKVSIHKLP